MREHGYYLNRGHVSLCVGMASGIPGSNDELVLARLQRKCNLPGSKAVIRGHVYAIHSNRYNAVTLQIPGGTNNPKSNGSTGQVSEILTTNCKTKNKNN